MDYKLTGIVGDGLKSWDLKQGDTRIGRSSDVPISLPEGSVSRAQAVIRRDGDSLIIEDLGSRNGTSVNGKRIDSPQPLKANDSVAFGNLTMKIVTEELMRPTLTEHTQLDSTFKLNWNEVQEMKSEEAQDGSQLFQVLTELGEFLVRHQPREVIYEACLDTVERLVPFQRACLLTLNDAGEPEMRGARTKGDSSELELALSQTMVQTVISERASLLVRDAQSDTRFQAQESVILGKIRSALVAPLFDNTSVIGVLYVDTSELSHAYTRDHLKRLALLANILAVKITNARLLDVQLEKERMQREMAVAEKIQRTLLAGSPPVPEGYELSVRLEPCTEVGGDLYDVLKLSNEKYAIVLGDVVGHGVGAAMLMANALAAIRALADLCESPLEVVKRLHDQMMSSTSQTDYLTMFFGFLDPTTHELRYVNAGHQELPLILTPGHDAQLLLSTGPPIGLIDGIPFEESTTVIPPQGLLCVWSDGISEAHLQPEDEGEDEGEKQEFFGDAHPMDKLCRVPATTSLEHLSADIFKKVESFLGGSIAPDDRTLVLLRRT